MAEINIDTIKSAFENGDVPTQADFENLIDSSHNSLAHTNADIANNIVKTDAVHTTVQSNSASWTSGGTPTSASIEWIVYNTIEDLPAAADSHGMFAHVHATGKAYYAHAGNWIELATSAISIDLGSVDQHIIPAADTTYDLGSPNFKFKDLYLSGNTIYLGDQALSYDQTDGLKLGNQRLKDAIGVPTDVSELSDNTAKFAQSGNFSGSYNDLINKPTIPVDVNQLTDTDSRLFNGSWNSLSNKPTIFDGDYSKLYNTPTIFDGDYNNLANKPTIFDGDYNNLANKPSVPRDVSDLTDTTSKFAQSGNFSGSYADLTGKPTIPTDVSDLSDNTNKLVKTINWSDIQGKPVIPTALGDLTGQLSYSTKITGKPTIPADLSDLTDTNGLLGQGGGDGGRAVGVQAVLNINQAPADPSIGDLIYDRATESLNVWSGTAWIQTGGSGGGGGSGGISITTTVANEPATNAGVTISGDAGIMISFDAVIALGRVIQTLLHVDGDIVASISYPVDYVGTNLQVITSVKTWDVQFPAVGNNLYLATDSYTTNDRDGDGVDDSTDEFPDDPTRSSASDTTGTQVTLTSVVTDEIVADGMVSMQANAGAAITYNTQTITDGTNTTLLINIDGEVVYVLNYPVEYVGESVTVTYQGNSWVTAFGADNTELNLLTSGADQPPTITLNSPSTTSVPYLGTWNDPGATVTDDTLAANAYDVTYGNTGPVDPATPGTYSVIYTTHADAVGQTSTVTRNVTVTNQAPTLTVNGSSPINLAYKQAGGYSDAGVTVNDELVTAGNPQDITPQTTITYTAPGGTPQDVTSTGVNTDNVGTYTYTYTVTDDNNQVATASRTVNVNNTAPVITLQGANPHPWLTGTDPYVDPGFTVTDETKTVSDVIVTGSVDPTTTGTYYLYYNLTDEWGGNATQRTRTIQVGNAAPVLALVGSADSTIDYKGAPYNDQGVTVTDETLTTSDVSTSIEHVPQIGDSTPQSVANVDVNNSGVYTITYSVGPDENAQTDSVNRIVRVINDAPTVTLINNTDTYNKPAYHGGAYSDPGVTVTDETATTTDVVKTYTRNGSPVAGPINTDQDGTYTITYTVTDDQGLQGSATRTVTVTNQAPAVTLKQSNVNSVAYLGSWTDPGVNVTDETRTESDVVKSYTLNGSTTTGVDPTTPGTYVITYTVTDDLGLTGSVTRTVTVTNQAPTITLAGGGNTSVAYKGSYTEPVPAYTVTDEDVSSVTVARTITRNGSALANGATVDTSTPGTYTITYTATDDGGNTDSVSRTITVNANQTPTMTLLGANDVDVDNGGTYTEPDPAVTVTDETATVADVTRTVTRDGASIGDAVIDTNTAGTYVITYSVTDDQSNTASVTRTVTVAAANTDPVNQNVAVGELATIELTTGGQSVNINAVSIVSDQTFSGTVQFKFTAVGGNTGTSNTMYVDWTGADYIAVVTYDNSYEGDALQVIYNGNTYNITFTSDDFVELSNL